MPLIPARADAPADTGPPSLSLSQRALAMAGVETTPVARRPLNTALRAVGKIRYHEPSLATITARADGYAEKLFVNVTGVNIRAGDHLAEIYSPDMLLAQQELLIALRAGASGPVVESAKIRLRNWGLTPAQIDDLIASGKIADRLTLYSPVGGTVIEKTIVENSAFRAGDVLYRVANLDTVWADLDVYESDLPLVRYGQHVELVAEACPGEVFAGMVTFVEPVLDEQTRTIRVPVYIDNARHLLKPGMYVSAVIKAVLGPDGRPAPTGIEGKFTCRMHPQTIKDAAGPCPMCGMSMEQIPGMPVDPACDHCAPAPPGERYICPMKCEGEKTYDKPGNCPVCNMKLKPLGPPTRPATRTAAGPLAVPAGAVLDSGTRTIVYVEREPRVFEARQIVVGPRCGDWFPVLRGLAEGERVVARGGFLLDSQFQISGHPSLYYPGGLHAPARHQDARGAAPLSEQAPAEPTVPAVHLH